MKHHLGLLSGAILLFSALGLLPSFGLLTIVTDVNSAQGDFLDFTDNASPDNDPDIVFELGENSDGGGMGGPGFSAAFLIDVQFGSVYLGPASLAATKGAGIDITVKMKNISLNNWAEVWYIADAAPDSTTMISNFDGLAGTFPNAPSLLAFRIDAVGVNRPLIGGDLNANGIFEIGETWEFVLQDFTSNLNPALMNSQGLGDGFSPNPPGDDPSSGSIVAIPYGEVIPEPSRALLLLLGLVSMVAVRRRS